MQLHFKFDKNSNYSEDNFFLSKSNVDAFNFVTEKYRIGDLCKFFVITGEKGCGKTHLANIWKSRVGAKFIIMERPKNENLEKLYKELSKLIQKNRAYIIENIEDFDEEILLYIFNLIENKKAKLLLTSRKSLRDLNFKIKDLKSRILNIMGFEIKKPDRELIKALLVKYFSDRQVSVDDFTLNYIIPRISRSFVSINDFMARLNRFLNSEGGRMTVFTIKKILDD